MKTLAKITGFAILFAHVAIAAAARPSLAGGLIIPLYAKGTVTSLGVPEVREQRDGDLMIRNVSDPTLELFRPAPGRANGTAIIVAPGGGFVGLGYDAGGTVIAHRLAQQGFTAFVLKYRTIESDDDMRALPPAHQREMDVLMTRATTGLPIEVPRFAGEAHAVDDGQRAISMVRQRAAEWGIDPRRVGFLGLSAGGYLAVDLAIGDRATRPDFVGLIYGGLRTPVPSDTSPAFIAAAADDEYQPNDAAQLYSAWRRAGASAELHIYEHGGHGFDLKPKGTTSDHWFDEFIWWLQSRGLLPPNEKAPSHRETL